MEHLETNIRKIIKKGFEILTSKNSSNERDVQWQVVLPVLEGLGYSREDISLEKHCRLDKKDLYSDMYIEVDSRSGILIETKKIENISFHHQVHTRTLSVEQIYQ